MIVNPNAELAFSISSQRLESVTRRDLEVVEGFSGVELLKLPYGDGLKASGAAPSSSPGIASIEDILGACIRERSNHESMIARRSCYSISF